jgi:RimJ/RimL family protein N-acetyltransferase
MTDQDRIDCRDKTGQGFQAGVCRLDESVVLIEWYDRYQPLAESQGLPPREDLARRRWVQEMIDRGQNLVAWIEGRPVAHACLLPDPDRGDAEFVIFVDVAYRNRGLGTELTRLAVDRARAEGLKRVFLTVEPYNFRAIHLYRKIGFEFWESAGGDRVMVLELE